MASFPAGTSCEQLEERLQRIVARALVDRQEEHLRVEVVEGALEVGGLVTRTTHSSPSPCASSQSASSGSITTASADAPFASNAGAEMEQRQLRRRTDCIDARVRREPVRALRTRRPARSLRRRPRR